MLAWRKKKNAAVLRKKRSGALKKMSVSRRNAKRPPNGRPKKKRAVHMKTTRGAGRKTIHAAANRTASHSKCSRERLVLRRARKGSVRLRVRRVRARCRVHVQAVPVRLLVQALALRRAGPHLLGAVRLRALACRRAALCAGRVATKMKVVAAACAGVPVAAAGLVQVRNNRLNRVRL